MARVTLLLTNNPALATVQRSRLSVHFVDGTGNDVLCAARDKIHLGWRLLNHPLYGNFRPYHQPFRSILVAEPHQGAAPEVDTESLHLLEQALNVYASCVRLWATPASVPPEMHADCSYIDVELMRASLDSVT